MKNLPPSELLAASALDVPPTSLDQYPPAPPCAQPMDPVTKHLAWGFGILAAALLVVLNAQPPAPPAPAPPIACVAPQQ